MLLLLAIILLVTLIASVLSTLTYALRDYSRARLEDLLARRQKSPLLAEVYEHQTELVFLTAGGRLLAQFVLVLLCERLFAARGWIWEFSALAGLTMAWTISMVASVALPTSLALHFGEFVIALFIVWLHAMRAALAPLSKVMSWSDQLVRHLAGRRIHAEPEMIEKDLLSVVEEGEKEGIVDTQERQMIESVIEFRDTQTGQTMTARPEIVAIESGSAMEDVRRLFEESGHSRIPIYDGTLDHIIGILYARDLIKHLGLPAGQFDIRAIMRPAIFVPETKPLRDLLRDFRTQKVHLAVVLDEYGGTAGLVTIEDILEELVGEIVDEHEPHEPPMLKKVAETVFEADARLRIDDANRQMGLQLAEDAGYETLGGFVSIVLGQIPQQGTTFDHKGLRFTVLDAQPHRVKRMKVEILPIIAQ